MLIRWEPVAGYDGIYEVSDTGQILSLARRKVVRDRTLTFKPRLMKLSPGNDHGHLRVGLTDADGVLTHHWVHRLVATAFCDRNDGQDYVLHGPGGPADNRASQLRWGTAADNHADMVVHGTLPVYVPATHCPNGHEYTPENVWVWAKRNERRCRQCARDAGRRYRVANPKPTRGVVAPPPRPCRSCDKEFTPARRTDAVFCSSNCGRKYRSRC